MRHLSEAEFVDLAENETAMDPRRAAHVDACATCRGQLDALRSMLRESKRVEVPEPSPLFWEHLSRRLREELAAEPAPARSGWSWSGFRSLVPIAAAAAVIVAVISGVLMVRTARDGTPAVPGVERTAGAALVVPAPARPDAMPDEDNADVWAVLTAAASEVKFEDARAAGMRVLPAAIDHAVQDLTGAELTELGRLLQSELKRSAN